MKNDITNLEILLVDDNPVNQLLFTRLLEDEKAKVKVANNGKEAIEILSSEKFDIILMDIQMPIMNGFEAIKIIRSRAEFKSYKIIAITGNGNKQKCLEAGADSYLPKPFLVKDVKTEILKLINC
jgi:CheY-like chemotaxis protein